LITSLRLKNFKCFRELCLEMGPVTLLSGLNGMGKSSVIQSLLLLRQSYDQKLLDSKGISLIGDLVKIGTARDVLFEDAQEETLSIEMNLENGNRGKWESVCKPSLSSLLAKMPSTLVDKFIYQSSLFNDDFHYLEAERIGPRTSYELFDITVRQHRQLGKRGEYATYFLSIFGDEKLTISLLEHPDGKSRQLSNQVEAWLGELCGSNIRIYTHEHPGMDLVNLGYSFQSEKQAPGNEYRATNVGFGITFTLPIILALLSSKKGSLIILENPESHLHPKGQVMLGRMISKAASAGMQIILETHSDHILNGIRIAVREGIVTPQEVRIHFFEKSKDSASSQAVSPNIDKNGRLDFWPDGFFDEWEKSLENLI